MINKTLAKKILEEGLVTGADFSEIYYEETYSHNICYDNENIESIGSTSARGVGIRLLKENRSVYGYTNKLDEKNLISLTKKLAGAFHEQRIINCKDFVDKKVKIVSSMKESYFNTPTDKKIELLKIVSEEMKNYSPFIKRTVVAFIANKKCVEIYNSNGLHIKDKKERVHMLMEPFAVDGDKHEMGYDAPGVVGGMEYFYNLDLKKLARKAAKEAVGMLKAKECPSGKMPVIVGNGFGGVLFHEACGHSLEATAVGDKLSVFADRLGEQIASPIVNAYDDGTLAHRFGANNIDDEGNPTERICLIKNGILTNYLIDNFNGRKMNKKGNGTCRRQSYKYEPTSRMSNTYIDNGTSTFDEIIKNTKLGLYAAHLGGGSVNPATGEFEFACSVAYIVRDGKIAEQVKGATLIGTGEEVLKNIDMIGNDLDFDAGYCGASSGSVPVATGQPTIRIKSILVGGAGGKLE